MGIPCRWLEPQIEACGSCASCSPRLWKQPGPPRAAYAVYMGVRHMANLCDNSWISRINSAFDAAANAASCASKAAYFPPALAEDIGSAEVRLNVIFPQSLRSLLLETDGVMSKLSVHRSEWFDNMWLILPIREILAENCRTISTNNQSLRNKYQTLFFAGAGCDGILFGFPINREQAGQQSVVVWHPIRDTLEPVAQSLKEFIDRWLGGTIKV